MPQDVNLAQPLANLNPGVAASGFGFTSWERQTAEVPVAQCRYVHMRPFSGDHQTGTMFLDRFLAAKTDTLDAPRTRADRPR